MIVTLSGSNSFGLRAELNRLVADFVAEHGDMAVEKVDGEEVEYERITEAIQSLPFLSAKKLVLLYSPGVQKQFLENFESLIETIPDSVDVIIVEPKPDKRSSYYKQLQKKTDFKTFNELGERELPKWLAEQAKKLDGSLGLVDAAYLVNRVGANQQMLGNELEKLVLYDPKVTKETIDLLTEPTPQSTVFQLLDAAFAGRHQEALRLYNEQKSLKVDPLAIVAMLAWQLHVLAVIKTAGERSVDEIAREAKINPFVVRKSMSIAKKLSLARLKELIHELHELDIKMKSTSIDADEALQTYLVNLTSS